MTNEALEYRVEFATPYGNLMRGAALAGLRRFGEAHEALANAHAEAVRCADLFGQQGVYAGRIRALLHEGKVAEACALEPPDLSESLPAMRGEVWASRGLALACMGRLDEAVACALDVRGTTRAVEPKCPHSLCPGGSDAQELSTRYPAKRCDISWMVLSQPGPSTSLSRAIGRVRTCLPPCFAIRAPLRRLDTSLLARRTRH